VKIVVFEWFISTVLADNALAIRSRGLCRCFSHLAIMRRVIDVTGTLLLDRVYRTWHDDAQ